MSRSTFCCHDKYIFHVAIVFLEIFGYDVKIPIFNILMSTQTIKCANTGKDVEFSIHSGFDAEKLSSMQSAWGVAKVKLLAEILQKYPESKKDPRIFWTKLIENNAEDFHWDWIGKAWTCNTEEYHWFYLTADHDIQAACIIYHPHDSKIDGEKIFYVDYLATAYWNRAREGYQKRFSGLGSILLSYSTNFAIDILGYRPGFSLHSLPKAEGYYKKIGMKDMGVDISKENLRYFEAEKEAALKIANGAGE